ncbi:MAG: PIN domain-containing protein [Planctomycetaceae bacterium]
MDPSPTVVLDACVLYSAPLRDLLIRVAQASLIRARWTEDIHAEWMRNVLIKNPQTTLERLSRTKSLMNAAVRDCLVTGFHELVATLHLPDPDDRHVLAAAIRAKATAIVTFNLRDFPDKLLAPHGITAVHPDGLLSSLLDDSPDDFCVAAQQQRAALKNPPKSVAEYLATLELQGLIQTATKLREFRDRI